MDHIPDSWRSAIEQVRVHLAQFRSAFPASALQLHLAELARKQRDLLEPARSAFAALADFQRAFGDTIRPALERFAHAVEELPSRTRNVVILLADHGWYLDFEAPLSELWRLQEMLSEGQAADVEQLLCEHYDDRLLAIENLLVEAFPRRAQLLRSALSAHRRGEYALSIPLLLAQTDGICCDIIGASPFRSSKGKPATAAYVDEQAADTLRSALLVPLARKIPINASEPERPRDSKAPSLPVDHLGELSVDH